MIMNKGGEYQEPLKTGGKLIVTSSGWRIEYYFMGPDLRYNGHFVRIESNRVDDYIKAFKANFEKFEEIQNAIPSDGSFEMKGECDMIICVRGYKHGVNITYSGNNTFPIKTREKLQEVIDDYEYCILRAEEITKLLFKNVE